MWANTNIKRKYLKRVPQIKTQSSDPLNHSNVPCANTHTHTNKHLAHTSLPIYQLLPQPNLQNPAISQFKKWKQSSPPSNDSIFFHSWKKKQELYNKKLNYIKSLRLFLSSSSISISLSFSLPTYIYLCVYSGNGVKRKFGLFWRRGFEHTCLIGWRKRE